MIRLRAQRWVLALVAIGGRFPWFQYGSVLVSDGTCRYWVDVIDLSAGARILHLGG